ncbi:putative bifunctional diguanylate cyclase/phosphodiesterase [Massilia sp. DWR3-1-1]|uniref:putative bifunctional diguanylate cyclase/phosphodiesterase n=1 Tax=Massilia sp. DWR3-1-1 TaxID=2804559 RepID=UPI003CF4EFB0
MTVSTPLHCASDADRETRRLNALRALNLLDTAPSEAFDRITRLAARLFDLPIAAVSLTDSDRQWFKSRVGTMRTEIARVLTPCDLVTAGESVLVVEDLLRHPTLCNSVLAADGVRFFAGAPLFTRDGYCLGAMCVLGTAPRSMTAQDLATLQDLAAMVMAQIELQHALGRLDPISGLPNRTEFIEDFDDFCRDQGAGADAVALMLNLAKPEELDDAVRVMGVAYVEEMMEEAIIVLRTFLGPGHKIYHVGATRFVCLLDRATDHRAAVARLRQMLAGHADKGSARFVTTATFGLAPFVTGVNDVTGAVDVLRWCHSAAHDALAKPGLVSVYDQHHDAVYRRRFTLLNAFGAALEGEGQLHLEFQPRIDLHSGKCTGAEALLRWTHPQLGVISPGEFIPVVERTALMRATTAFVLEQTLAQLARWQAAGITLGASVNVSPANLVEADFAASVIAALARHGVPAARLELEVTETAVMEKHQQASAALASLAAAGIGLAIDDFGTGYSSLSYLQILPADVVKIDQSFIRAVVSDERTRDLVATMIRLSHSLGYRVVAEGVETAAVLETVRALGCDEVQGYYFARPMRPDALLAWHATHAAAAGQPLR